VKSGVACLAVTMMFSGCKDENPDPTIGFAYHDNEVQVATCFADHDGNLPYSYPVNPKYDQWTITEIYFTITAFDVTQGQDPDKCLKVGDSQASRDVSFSFRFGRKASKEVANSFNAVCPPDRNTFNHKADELNFWVKGTMALRFQNGQTYTFPNTYFAQGHVGASNNWWFGNDAMTNYHTPIIIFDPYSTHDYYIPVPIYLGEKCFGYISPVEDPNLVFKFNRGDGAMPNPKNWVDLIGVYRKDQPTEPW